MKCRRKKKSKRTRRSTPRPPSPAVVPAAKPVLDMEDEFKPWEKIGAAWLVVSVLVVAAWTVSRLIK